MFKNPIYIAAGLLVLSIAFAFTPSGQGKMSAYFPDKEVDQATLKEMYVEDALLDLGDEKPIHFIEKLDADSARMGEEMVKYGRLLDKSNKRISKYFVCTDCHNVQMESADPADESPAAVLEYSKKNKIPFLPASTFYGMFNKRHWYNGDYEKKYGDLVAPTRDTLANAIQLCAVQCSQGRELVNWEIRSIMHYYKSIGFKIKDLNFSKEERKELKGYISKNNDKAIGLLKKKYSQANPATFGHVEKPKMDSYQPNAENGEYIYQYGCLHCHAVEKEMTNFDLGNNKLDFKFLHSKFEASHHSLLYVTRKGTYAFNGRRQYMPQYSMEKMSDEQLLDLMYYITSKAEE
ncbi:MAG: c-type cytochrome [Flavobacteriales bacterium]|nr:c-type cytochrome [Flavobacteriales bacterium]